MVSYCMGLNKYVHIVDKVSAHVWGCKHKEWESVVQ